MEERVITLSRFEEPKDLPNNHVWIFVKEREKTADYIKAAIRMKPTKLVINSELFGLFQVTNV